MFSRDLKRAFGVSRLHAFVVFGLLVWGNPVGNQALAKSTAGPITCNVWRVYDGDTFSASCEVWMGTIIKTNIRVRGMDTPERGGRAKCERERQLGLKARNIATRILRGRDVILTNIRHDKYAGRALADVQVGQKDFVQLMKAQAVARSYDGGKRKTWCDYKKSNPASS